MTSTAFPWGQLQGQVQIPPEVLAHAAQLAKMHYAEAEAIEFSGNDVEDYALPGWLAGSHAWLPVQELRALGFERIAEKSDRVLATASVGPHVDDADGPTLLLVLFNDGLRFKQGRHVHAASAGEWMVFNDSIKHEVRDGKNTTTYLVLSIPLKSVA